MEALKAASAQYPKPKDFRPSYGTAGFRALAALLPSTMFRCGRPRRAPLACPLACLPPPSTTRCCGRRRANAGPAPPVRSCGVLLAVRALKMRQVTGICITASHNPAPDNGVKLVEPNGEMLVQDWEVRRALKLLSLFFGPYSASRQRWRRRPCIAAAWRPKPHLSSNARADICPHYCWRCAPGLCQRAGQRRERRGAGGNGTAHHAGRGRGARWVLGAGRGACAPGCCCLAWLAILSIHLHSLHAHKALFHAAPRFFSRPCRHAQAPAR